MTKEKLIFEDMTTVGTLLFYLGQIGNGVLHRQLPEIDFLRYELEVKRVAGFQAAHPAYKSPLIPFVERFLLEANRVLNGEKNETPLVALAKVVNGMEASTYELHYDASEVADLKNAPMWLKQVLEVGGKLQKGINDDSTSPEKLGGLWRNIPGDTTLGILALQFLDSLVVNPKNLETASRYADMLKGEMPLDCTVKVQGLYTELNFFSKKV